MSLLFDLNVFFNKVDVSEVVSPIAIEPFDDTGLTGGFFVALGNASFLLCFKVYSGLRELVP